MMRHVKFRKKRTLQPQIPTTALPDIIFILLFFFMATTVPNKTYVRIVQTLPQATQLRKLAQRSLIKTIYIGQPQQGKSPVIQCNDALITINQVSECIQQAQAQLSNLDREQLVIALKVDEAAPMGLVADVQQQLRKVGARRIVYTTIKKSKIP